MGTLEMFVTLVVLGGGTLALAYVFLGIAFRWLLRFKRDGGDGLIFTVYLLALVLGAGFFTVAAVGVTIASVQGSHIMPG
jgi:hypothetical protein